MKQTNLYCVHGGIGKQVIFTSMIEELAKRDNNKISVGSGFPEVYKYHPKVVSSPQWSGGDLNYDIAEYFSDIIFREPYVSSYSKRDRHILDEWPKMFGLNPFEQGGLSVQPDLYLGQQFITEAKNMNEKLASDFIMVQWTGGQPAQGATQNKQYPVNNMTEGRNVQNYADIWLALAEEFPNYKFLLYRLPNEPVSIPETITNRVAFANTNALTYAAMLKHAKTFVSLDSSLQHFSAARQINKPGVVMWGTVTKREMIGHSMHENLRSYSATEVKVEPQEVVDAVRKVLS